MELDPVSLRIVWDRLVAVVNESSRILQRSAFSTLVRECNDFACGLLTTSGETLAIADNALPSFATTQSLTLSKCLERFPLAQWRPGDVLITNDPWIGTGQIMDLTLLKGVFHRGRLVAFAGAVAHSPDLGGVQRWSGASDIFEEGLSLPTTFLYEEGRPNETLLSVIRANSRLPHETMGDIDAQLAALEVSERRLLQILEEHEIDDLDAVAEQILGRTEQAMRDAIAELPDGSYPFRFEADSFPGPLDSGRMEAGSDRVEVVASITVAGTELTVDLSRSSPEVQAAINSVYPFTFAYALYALRFLLLPNVPQNGGSVRPVDVVAKEGTIFNAAFPSPTLNRSVLGHLVCDAIFGALTDLLPDRVWAMSGSTPIWLLILIGNDVGGRPYQRIVPINGGLGATEGTDGEVCSFPANLSNAEIEIIETATPVLCECKEMIADTGGAGRFRGGPGVRFGVRMLRPAAYSIASNRVTVPPAGYLGGAAGQRGRVLLNDVELQPGAEGKVGVDDLLVLESPGGGGLGAVETRDPERVQRDLDEGLVKMVERGQVT